MMTRPAKKAKFTIFSFMIIVLYISQHGRKTECIYGYWAGTGNKLITGLKRSYAFLAHIVGRLGLAETIAHVLWWPGDFMEVHRASRYIYAHCAIESL